MLLVICSALFLVVVCCLFLWYVQSWSVLVSILTSLANVLALVGWCGFDNNTSNGLQAALCNIITPTLIETGLLSKNFPQKFTEWNQRLRELPVFSLPPSRCLVAPCSAVAGRWSWAQKQTGWEPIFTLQIRLVDSGRRETCRHVVLFSGSFWDVDDNKTTITGSVGWVSGT